jgi:hypothetical protein
MKTLRLLTIVTLAILVLSSWMPAPVHAQSFAPAPAATTRLTLDAGKPKVVKLVVNNRTGGTLFVRLSGPAIYSFSTSSKGKTTFTNIKPGIYTITVSASNCSGTMTFKRKFNGTVGLRPFVCRKH